MPMLLQWKLKMTQCSVRLGAIREMVGRQEKTTDFLPYFYNRRIEITIEQSILFWDGRVIMPLSLQSILLLDLLSEHTGIVRMKRIARRYLWWPKLDKEIGATVNSCNTCQENARAPSKATGNWSWPAAPGNACI